MPEKPLLGLVRDMNNMLRTTTYDREEIRRRQKEHEELEGEAEGPEPGEPELS